jgi:hypothetical protein
VGGEPELAAIIGATDKNGNKNKRESIIRVGEIDLSLLNASQKRRNGSRVVY